MKQFAVLGALVVCLSFTTGCSRKQAQANRLPPKFGDNGYAERRAACSGTRRDVEASLTPTSTRSTRYIVSRDTRRAASSKRAISFFRSIRGRSRLHRHRRKALRKRQSQPGQIRCGRKTRGRLFDKKVISDQERDTALAAAQASKANIEADEAAVKQTELNLAYTKSRLPSTALQESRMPRSAIRRPEKPHPYYRLAG